MASFFVWKKRDFIQVLCSEIVNFSSMVSLWIIFSILGAVQHAVEGHFFQNYARFQSTLPRGERRSTAYQMAFSQKFQSTLPRGERHSFLFPPARMPHFNPRSHEGSDSNFRQKVLFSLSKNCLKYLILTTNYFN